MRRIYSMAGLLALSCSAADAQNYSTNCMAIGSGMVHCNSTATNGDADLGASIAALAQRIRDRRFRAHLTKFLEKGDCHGALTYAVENGRYEALDAIKQVCPS